MFHIFEKLRLAFFILGRKFALFTAIAAMSFSGTANHAYADPGDLDPTFGVNGLATITEPGYVGPFYGVAIQPDGKIVAQGSGVVPYSSSAPYLVRFNGNGSLDSGFGSGGVVLVDPWGGFTSALAIQSDGKVLTALWSSVVRYSASGVLETTFPSNLQTGLAILDIEIQPDGKILVAGGDGLVRYNSDGTYDTSFGNGGKAQGGFAYVDIALQSNGKIAAAGNISGDMLLNLYNADGTFDTSFGSNGVVVIPSNNQGGFVAVSTQSDGKILTTSNSYRYITPYPAPPFYFIDLRRFNTDGTLDSSFGTGGLVETNVNPNAHGIANAVQPDGKILVTGHDSGGIIVARYHTDGSLDPDFDGGMVTTGPYGDGNAIALQSDGKVVVAGWWGDGNTSGPSVVRYLVEEVAISLPTPVGTDVSLVFELDEEVTITFSEVTAAGDTTVTETSTVPPPPSGFQTGNPPLYYDIQTTATYTAPVTLCFTYNSDNYVDPGLARLFHYESGVWVDVTTSNDTVNEIICGQVSSLSPFAIFTASATPEELLEALIERVESYNLKQKISNKLDAKLEAALDALEAAKKHSISKACKKLDSFLKKVQAQSGKGLTVDQASQLTNDANQVEELLSCN